MGYSQASYKANPFELWPRECEALELLAQGYNNKEIANRMSLTERSAENYVSAVFGKLGLSPGGGIYHRRVKAALMWWSAQPLSPGIFFAHNGTEVIDGQAR